MSIYILYCETPYGVEAGPNTSQCPDAYRKEVAVDLQALLQFSSATPKLDSANVAEVFGVGFSVVVLFFLVGRGVGEVLRLIRRG